MVNPSLAMQKSRSVPDLTQECLSAVLVKEKTDLPNFNAGYFNGAGQTVYTWGNRSMPSKNLTFTKSDLSDAPKLPQYQFRVQSAPGGPRQRSASVSSCGEIREGLYRPHFWHPLPGLSFAKVPGYFKIS